MIHIEMNLLEESGHDLPDRLKLAQHEAVGTLRIFTGRQSEYWVSLIPALNVSGYGENEEDAFQALKENLHTFFDDLFELSETDRNTAMETIGWEKEKAFSEKFSHPLMDEQQVLQNFDYPEQVKKLMLQTA